MRVAALCCLLCSLAAATRTQDETYSLVWKPVQGQSSGYGLTFETKEQDARVVVTLDLTMKVLSVETNGDYAIETSYANSKITVNGEAQDAVDPPKSDVQKYNAHGGRIGTQDDSEEEGPFGSLISSLLEFEAPKDPVKVGDRWHLAIKGDEAKKTRPVKVDFTLETADKDGLRVRFSAVESEGDKPAKASGTYTIDSSDGSLVKLDASLDNVRLSDDESPTSAHLRMDRRSKPAKSGTSDVGKSTDLNPSRLSR